MGTNYYLIEEKCKACGRGGSKLHIGKKSDGWRFLFQISIKYPTPEKLLLLIEENKNSIYNEYDKKISFEEFKKVITDSERDMTQVSGRQYDYTDREFS